VPSHRTSSGLPWRCGLPFVALLAVVLATAGGCAGVRWDFDYAQAQRESQRQNRPVLLYFWDWLSIDRSRMDSEVWSDPRVIAETRRVIVVPLEQGWFPDMVKKYQVESAPTLILLSPQGTEVARLKGVPTPEELVTWLRTSLAQPAATRDRKSVV
jgi:hypothetical protein